MDGPAVRGAYCPPNLSYPTNHAHIGRGLTLWCPRATGNKWPNLGIQRVMGNAGSGIVPNTGARRGVAFSFDGTGGAVKFGSVAFLSLSRFSLTAWVWLISYGGNWRIFDAPTASAGTPCMFVTSGQKVVMQKQDIAQPVSGNITVPLGQWTHVGCVYDGANASVYVNGALDTSAAASLTFSGWLPQIGAYSNGTSATNRFKGYIDNPKVWNRPLSLGEMRLDFAQPYAAFGGPDAMRPYAVGAGGTTWTKSLSDALSLTDGRALLFGKAASDSLALADSLTRGAGKLLSNALSLADTVSAVKGAAIVLSEVFGLTDSRALSLAKALVETLPLLDTRTFATAKAIGESFGLTDSATAVIVGAALIVVSLSGYGDGITLGGGLLETLTGYGDGMTLGGGEA